MADVLFATLQVPGTAQLEFALQQELGQELVDATNSVDSRPLHVAVWRGGAHAVQRLLDAGAAPDQQDGESGWTPLHKALYLGNLQAAAALLQAGASLNIADQKGRLPLDLLSAELKAHWPAWQAPAAAGGRDSRGRGGAGRLRHEGSCDGGGSIVFSWGNGANLQLGTGSTDLHLSPVRIDTLLHAAHITALTAAKYHSAAAGSDGSVYTWGWGRGGRLGHPDFFIHSGQAAQILPRRVEGLGKRQVVSIAAAKHHTLAATSSGELFSWGSNKDGRLGYATPDTQPVPRKVALLRPRIVAVAAANKHSAAVSASGEVFTWGANSHGQLGYGTSDSGSNPVPRVVDAMKGRALVAVAAAKYHTVVLTAEGDIYQWGHKVVTPRYISLAGSRDTARAGPATPATATPGTSQAAASSNSSNNNSGGSSGGSMRFHRGQGEVSRPMAVAVAAGAAHTSCITRAGVVLAWRSDAVQGPVREVGGALAGRRAVQLSAGKYRTAVVTDTGDVFAWEVKDKRRKAMQQHESGVQGSATPGATAAAAAAAVAAAAVSRGVPESSAAMVAAVTAAAAAAGATPGQQQQQQQEDAAQSSHSMTGATASAAAVTSSNAGGTNSADAAIQPERVPGLRRATFVAVGEKHSLALQRWSAPALPADHSCHLSMLAAPVPLVLPVEADGDDAGSDGAESLSPHAASRQGTSSAKQDDWTLSADGLAAGSSSMAGRHRQASRGAGSQRESTVTVTGKHADAGVTSSSSSGSGSSSLVPRLQHICERVVAMELVEPRTTLPILEYADVAGAQLLRSFCLAVALRNLEVVVQEARASVESTPAHLMRELEQHYKAAVLDWRVAAAAVAAAPAGSSGSLSTTAHASAAHTDAAAAASARSNEVAGVHAGRSQGQQLGQPQASAAPTQAPLASHIFSTLQPGCRPTSAPVWLTADSSDTHSRNAYHSLAVTAHVAAGAGPLAAAGAAGDGGRFTTDGGSQAAAAHEAVVKLQRTVLKKLQQIAHLEQRQQEGAALDAQQLAKANQKASLLEALRLLQQGGPSAHTQASALVAQAQATAAKLTSWAEAAAAAGASPQGGSTPLGPGDGLRQRSRTRASSMGGGGGTGSAGAGSGDLKGADDVQRPAAAEHPGAAALTARPAMDLASVQAQLAAAEALICEDAGTAAAGAAAVAASPAGSKHASASKSAAKRTPSQQRKGDLSVFLRGALDKPLQAAPAAASDAAAAAAAPGSASPAAAAKAKGPAWGGAGVLQPCPQQPGSSLRELLSHASSGASSSGLASIPTAAGVPRAEAPSKSNGSNGSSSHAPAAAAGTVRADAPARSATAPPQQAGTPSHAHASVCAASTNSTAGRVGHAGSCPSPSTPATATAHATAAGSSGRSTASASSPGLPPLQQRLSTTASICSSAIGVNSPTPPLPQPRKGTSALHMALERQALLPAVGKSPFAAPAGRPGSGAPSPGHAQASPSGASEAGSSSGVQVSLFDLLSAKRAAPVQRSPAAATGSSRDVTPVPAWGGARGASPPGSFSSTRQQQQTQQQTLQQGQPLDSPQQKVRSLRDIQAEQEQVRLTTGVAALQRERAAAAAAGAGSAGALLHLSSSASRTGGHVLGSSPQHASPLALMAAAGGISGAVAGASGAGTGGVLGTSPASASWGMGSWGSYMPASSPPVQSKWYVSEQPHMRSLADIQNEEVAAQQEAASQLLARMLEEEERARAVEAKRQARAAERAARKATQAEKAAAGKAAAGKAAETAQAENAASELFRAGRSQHEADGKAGVVGKGPSKPAAGDAAAAAADGHAGGAATAKAGTRRGAADAAPSAAATTGSAREQEPRRRRSRQPHSIAKGSADGAGPESATPATASTSASGQPFGPQGRAQQPRRQPQPLRKTTDGAGKARTQETASTSGHMTGDGDQPDVKGVRDARGAGSMERGGSSHVAHSGGRGTGLQRGGPEGGRGGGRFRVRQGEQERQHRQKQPEGGQGRQQQQQQQQQQVQQQDGKHEMSRPLAAEPAGVA